MDNTEITLTLTSKKQEARVDTRLLAAYLDLQHHSIFETIKDHRDSFEQLGIVRFQTEVITGRGRPERFALLNEDQTYFLLALSRNTPRVVPLKLALVKAFRDSRHALELYQTAALPSFKALQDAAQGVPGGAGAFLYSNINKLVNATAGMTAGARMAADATQQALLTVLQNVAASAIAAASGPKDAYQRVKEAMATFSCVFR